MAGPIYLDRAKELTNTTGTGTYTLAGAVTGFQSFAGVGNSNTCYYAITDGTNWEVGLGTYTSSGTTLARTSILSSSNSNAAVSWSAGSKPIWVDFPAVAAAILTSYTLSGYTAAAVQVGGTVSLVVAKVNASGVYGFGHPIDYGTSFPVFKIDTTYSQPKLQVRSIIAGDPGDTPEYALLIVDGTPTAPTNRTAPYPGAFIYSWPMDTSGNFVPADPGFGLGYPYNGRNIQLATPIIETPTPTARGGAFVISPAMPGEVAVTDRVVAKGIGMILLGRGAREDGGVTYPWNPALYPIEAKSSPGGQNYYNTEAIGNLTVIMSNATDAPGIAMRKFNSNTNGVDFGFDYAENAWAIQRVDSGAKSTAGLLHWTNGLWEFGINNTNPSLRIGQQLDGTGTSSWVRITGNTTPVITAESGSTNVALSLTGRGNLGVIIGGTGTNDSAAAGKVGEIIESTVLVGAAVALTTATPANVTSISLTAGDWNVWGNIAFAPAATTTVTSIQGAVSQTSATLPTIPNAGAYALLQATLTTAAAQVLPLGWTRISLAATTAVYLVAQMAFGTSTATAYGYIGARRVR